MIFFYHLERFEFIAIVVIFIVLAAVFYYFSIRSRKKYRCPECGEIVMVEHMETSRCGMCGALLKEEEL